MVSNKIRNGLITLFEPIIKETGCTTYYINTSHIPLDDEIEKKLDMILTYNYKTVSKDLSLGNIPIDAMNEIKSYLSIKPLITIKRVKLYWIDMYLELLKKMKYSDQFDMMYYGPGEIDYSWSCKRLARIKNDIEYLERKKAIELK